MDVGDSYLEKSYSKLYSVCIASNSVNPKLKGMGIPSQAL